MNDIERLLRLVGEDRLIQLALNMIAQELDDMEVETLALFPDFRSDDYYVYLVVCWQNIPVISDVCMPIRNKEKVVMLELAFDGSVKYKCNELPPASSPWLFKAELIRAVADVIECVV